MKTLILSALAAAAIASPAFGATVFNGGDLWTPGNWDNGLPTSTNPGTIAVDGTFSVAANMPLNAVITQTAGNLVAVTSTSNVGFNTATAGTTGIDSWNMSGGSITARYFLANVGVVNTSGGTMTIGSTYSSSKYVQTANGGSWNISGSFVIDATESTGAPSGNFNFLSGWTGSWTDGSMSGTNWKDLITTTATWTLNGSAVSSTTFDNNFEVTNGGSTLSMIPEPSSAVLIGLAGLGLLLQRRRR